MDGWSDGHVLVPGCTLARNPTQPIQPPHAGIIDHFHLAEPIPAADWASRYQEGQKLKVRPMRGVGRLALRLWRLLHLHCMRPDASVGAAASLAVCSSPTSKPNLNPPRPPNPQPIILQPPQPLNPPNPSTLTSPPNQARIIYVDHAAKRAGLSLLPHLINYRMPSAVPMLGQVFESAVVRSIDPALGLLLELPSEPVPAPAFAHVSNLADARVARPEKVFKLGQAVAARVIGFRLVDGLALVSLKPSVISQQVRRLHAAGGSPKLRPSRSLVVGFGGGVWGLGSDR